MRNSEFDKSFKRTVFMSRMIMWFSFGMFALLTVGMVWLGITLSRRVSEDGLRNVIEEVWNGEESNEDTDE